MAEGDAPKRGPEATRFKPGQSGNPGGRPKEDAYLKELARTHTSEAIKTLVDIMKGKRSPAAARVSAAQALLDRGYGKPQQSVDVAGAVGTYAAQPIPVEQRDVDSMAGSAGTPTNGHTPQPH